jgi:cytochrome c peroxidase|tara:strand:- start:1423 stop:2823 length:1401 start_codon:yes stop_codon:yes gene_type:complete
MHNKTTQIITILGLAFIIISSTVDLDNLFNYDNQQVPNYITKDNTPNTNQIDNKTATLGRVLFYDKNLSDNNTVSCASCHQQAFAFSDPLVTSVGLNGENTGRHSMRLINSRFSNEGSFFWDERAASLEDQVTQPIQDHVEMGFSGTNGNPDFDDLVLKLSAIDYYQTLFEFAYGSSSIDENKIQRALAQFVRSIQSFDSKFDDGLIQVPNPNAPFPNYTTQENLGKQLFLAPPQNGGAGCAACHAPPEFDIDPNTLNNGIIGVAGSTTEIDVTNTRSPSLRDVVNPDGSLNGPLMHDGSLTSLLDVINHYNFIPNNPTNTNLDNRLNPPGSGPLNLNLTNNEKDALVAFLKTLTGTDVYINEIWSTPFDTDGNLTIVGSQLSSNNEVFAKAITIYPNPVEIQLTILLEYGNYQVSIYNIRGQLVHEQSIVGNNQMNLQSLVKGIYVLKIKDVESKKIFQQKFIKK